MQAHDQNLKVHQKPNCENRFQNDNPYAEVHNATEICIQRPFQHKHNSCSNSQGRKWFV